MSKIKIVLVITVIWALFVGCAKIPDNFITPTVKVVSSVENNKEMFIMEFSGSLKNDNDSTALIDVSGKIQFIDPQQKSVVETLDFKIPVILPYASEIVSAKIQGDEKKIFSLMELFKMSREKLQSQGVVNTYIDGSVIKLADLSYKKINIIKLLKEKIGKK